MKAILTLFLTIGIITCAFGQQSNYDRQAFIIARKASIVKTWDDALALLDTIELQNVDDPDTISYIVFSRKCASVAQQLGVARDSDPTSVTSVGANLDYKQLAVTLAKRIKASGILSTAQLALDAKRIQDRMPWYLQTDEDLAKKYDVK